MLFAYVGTKLIKINIKYRTFVEIGVKSLLSNINNRWEVEFVFQNLKTIYFSPLQRIVVQIERKEIGNLH